MSRHYMRQWLDDELKQLFIEDDHAAVVNWMLSHRGVPKVVLIGSGFSRNAVVKSGLGGSVAERTPLWPQVTEALRHGLGYSKSNEGPSDALQVAEQYQESVGATEFRSLLLRLLKDDEIEPGEAHNALQTFPAEAIITTNQLDTLLDRMEGKWHPVIECSDLPLARAQSSLEEGSGSAQVIYLHGHRGVPDTWVFSRSEYEDIEESRPAIVTRVQQLLSEYPLLVLGYSLSDPDFHALFRLVHNRLGQSKPRALCVTVGDRSPPRAEKAHWLNLGMYLAHMSKRGADGYASQIASLLRLEETLPSKAYVKKSLEGLGLGPASSVLKTRLNELNLIYDELERLEPSDHGLAELYYEAWKNCFPKLDEFEKRERERDEKLVQEQMAQYRASGGSLKRWTAQPAPEKPLKYLPNDRFAKYCLRGVPAILLAVDDLLGHENDLSAVADSVGEWVAFALRRNIFTNRSASLGSGANEEISKELLQWCREQLGDDGRGAAMQAVLDEAKKGDSLSILRVPALSSVEQSGDGVGPLTEMNDAWNAVWRADHGEALRKYDDASRIYRRQGDALGEWMALDGFIYSAHELSSGPGFALPEPDVRDRLEKRAADALLVSKELESRRPVRRFLGRKRRLVNSALALVEEISLDRSVEPGARTTRVTSIPRELVVFVCHCGAWRCHPAGLRQALVLAMKLDALEFKEGLYLGLQYAIDYTGEWLRRHSLGTDPVEQKRRSEVVGDLVRYIAEGIGATIRHEEGAYPTTYIAGLRKVMPRIQEVLDAASALILLRGLLELRRSMDEECAVCKHSFGSANLSVGFASMIVPIANCATGEPGEGGSVFAILREYVESVGGDIAREFLWRDLSSLEWGVLLASGGVETEAITDWLLASMPQKERWSEDLGFWAECIGKAIKAGGELVRPISKSKRIIVSAALEDCLVAKLNTRTQASLLEALSTVDSASVESKSLALLENLALEVSSSGNDTGTPSEQSRRFLSAFAAVVEVGQCSRIAESASPALREVIVSEVNAACASPPNRIGIHSRVDEMPFVFVAYALAAGFKGGKSREWLLEQMRCQDEPPVSTLGLCLGPDIWESLYGELVATTVLRANGWRLQETVRMVSNAVHDGRYLSLMLRGDFAWATLTAVQQIDSESTSVANSSAWAVMEISRQLGADDLSLPVGKAICAGLRRCAESPNYSVRVAVAFGLAKLAHAARTEEIRGLAQELVGLSPDTSGAGLANDNAGMVRALVRYGDQVGRVEAERMQGEASLESGLE